MTVWLLKVENFDTFWKTSLKIGVKGFVHGEFETFNRFSLLPQYKIDSEHYKLGHKTR